jgi:hypothetical protein
MKKKQILFVLMLFALSSCVIHRTGYNQHPATYSQPQENYNSSEANYGNSDLQVFYDELSPYGHWVYSSNGYGYVWIPDYDQNFRPYCNNGHWIYTNYGWTWVSEYSWGWAPFHYGQWIYDNMYGWEWVPGYDWAPAWVVWGQYNSYYGWAPMPPNVMAGQQYNPPSQQWVFVPQQNVTDVNINQTVINNTTIINNNITIINNTNTYNNKQYHSGPKTADVEKATGRKITITPITGAKAPGAAKNQGNTIEMYHPVINKNPSEKPAPKKVERLENIKTVNKSTNNIQQKDKNNVTQEPKTTATPDKNNAATQEPKTTNTQGKNNAATKDTKTTNTPAKNTAISTQKQKDGSVNNQNKKTKNKTNVKNQQNTPAKDENKNNPAKDKEQKKDSLKIK